MVILNVEFSVWTFFHLQSNLSLNLYTSSITPYYYCTKNYLSYPLLSKWQPMAPGVHGGEWVKTNKTVVSRLFDIM